MNDIEIKMKPASAQRYIPWIIREHTVPNPELIWSEVCAPAVKSYVFIFLIFG
jgi:hypothetical protein